MRDVHEVLYQKEMEIKRLKNEIDVLWRALPLLTDDSDRARFSTGVGVYQAAAPGAAILQYRRDS